MAYTKLQPKDGDGVVHCGHVPVGGTRGIEGGYVANYDDIRAGSMTQQWTVWCSCMKWDQVSGTKRAAAVEFKKSGWVKRRGLWVCAACANQERRV